MFVFERVYTHMFVHCHGCSLSQNCSLALASLPLAVAFEDCLDLQICCWMFINDQLFALFDWPCVDQDWKFELFALYRDILCRALHICSSEVVDTIHDPKSRKAGTSVTLTDVPFLLISNPIVVRTLNEHFVADALAKTDISARLCKCFGEGYVV